jgi:hypothetical protein
MFRLRREVERNELGLSLLVRDHDQLTRPFDAIDADRSGDLPFCFLHVVIAWSDDHVDPRNRCGPERKRRDRLDAADRKYLVNGAERTGCEYDRVGLTVLARRRDDDDTINAGHLRRDTAHDDGRWVGGTTTRNVDACACDRNLLKPDLLALGKLDQRLVTEVGFGDRPNVLDRGLECAAHIGIEPFQRFVEFLRGDAALGGRVGGVESPAELEDGFVPPAADRLEDLAHCGTEVERSWSERADRPRERTGLLGSAGRELDSPNAH